MERLKAEEDMKEELREDLIKILYEWGFAPYNISRVFKIQTGLVYELSEGVTRCKEGVCNDDGWLMEELMRMGFSKQEVGLLFGTEEVFVDTYIKKYRSKDITI